jgi:hypothetical protein
VPTGAEAFKKDVKKVEIKFFEIVHFALKTHLKEIPLAIVEFLGNNV